MELLLEFMGRGLVVMLMISMPCVLTAAGVGLVIGIVQAVTQVQEQTIAAAPKITAVFLVIMIFGVGYIRLLTNLFQEANNIAFNVVPKTDNYVLAADYYKYTKPFASEMKADSLKNGPSVDTILKNAGKPPYAATQERLKYSPASRQSSPSPNFIEKQKIMGR